MLFGTLGEKALIANTDTLLYTTPTDLTVPLTVNICLSNRHREQTAEGYVFITKTVVTESSWLEPGGDIPPRGVMERSAVVLGPGEKIIVRTTGPSVTARVHGM